MHILVLQDVHDVLDMSIQVNLRVSEMRPLTQTSESRRENLMAGSAQEWRHPLPTPATMPSAMNQYIRRHFSSSLCLPLVIQRIPTKWGVHSAEKITAQVGDVQVLEARTAKSAVGR